MALVSQDYQKNYTALQGEVVIQQMARDLLVEKVPFTLTHDDGTPTFEFMQVANRAYQLCREAGKATVEAESLGAVAHALLQAREALLKKD